MRYSAENLAQTTPAEVAELRAEVKVGLVELDRGEFAEFTAEDIIAEGLAALAATAAAPPRPPIRTSEEDH